LGSGGVGHPPTIFLKTEKGGFLIFFYFFRTELGDFFFSLFLSQQKTKKQKEKMASSSLEEVALFMGGKSDAQQVLAMLESGDSRITGVAFQRLFRTYMHTTECTDKDSVILMLQTLLDAGCDIDYVFTDNPPQAQQSVRGFALRLYKNDALMVENIKGLRCVFVKSAIKS
jgi:hypothetical protein